jgi:hypothetical protein
MKSTKPFTRTSVQIVELNRDFMPSSKSLLLWSLSACGGIHANSPVQN